MKDMMNSAQRAHELARLAVLHYDMGREDDAELAAVEAGRYGFEIPEAIAENDFLKRHFERGTAEATQDAEDAARVDALAVAGFDPF